LLQSFARTRRKPKSNDGLPRPIYEALIDSGLYNMARPRAFGGLELDPMMMFSVIEEVARHDSAAAWNLQIATGGHIFPAWFPDETVSEVLAAPNTVLAGSFSAGPQACEVDGGYVISGQTSFVIGAHNADWLFLLVQVNLASCAAGTRDCPRCD
jgi:indole-3-acetate monooxygenase